MRHEKMTYPEALDYLFGLQKYGIKFGLNKTTNLLKAFGNPHVGRKYIHIAGTNGKGSVSAMLAAMLAQSGLKIGFYSSPHLVRFTERFRVNDREMTPGQAAALTAEMRRAIDPAQPPTFFEFVTAMALVYFSREEVDLAVIEVGMGGRLDATNVIKPLVSVITNISLEHREFLGKHLLNIAQEKAGIIKKGTPLITAETRPALIDFFRSVCARKKAPFLRIGADVRYRTREQKLDYDGLSRRIKGLELGLTGPFQKRNAAVALAVIERLEKSGFHLTDTQIRQGLARTAWPGRLQIIARDPLIVLDGAHNPAGIRTLATAVRQYFQYRRLVLVVGIMQDKEIQTMLRAILPLADYVIYSRPAYYRAAPPETLFKQGAKFYKKKSEIVPMLSQAVGRAKQIARPADLILICGSLFTVGEALTCLDPVLYKPDRESGRL